jgi:HEPN domain-containing protein/predicted nucleotidyltransferase
MNELAHLPEHKQHEIRQVAEVIKEVVAPEKIILFGSYAKGTWVEDTYVENGIRYEYASDYDFLVVTMNRKEKDYVLTDMVVNRSRGITKVVVNVLVHDVNYVNEGLRLGQYFFTDIVKEGIVLYDVGAIQFAEAKALSSTEQKDLAELYYKEWFQRGISFLKGSKFYQQENDLKIAAFILHQSAESLFNTALLVFTGYKPKTHSLEKLRQHTKALSPELYNVFAIEHDAKEAHLFELLKRGYIDARYKQDYVITREELEQLIGKVGRMAEVVEEMCKLKLVYQAER